ncbi:jerky protein-like [Trichogramma pretiosum]|uniref:jerky protein-like n=1 Tax=Trichogramma pretiosum TaxID=7493 RepID=UPI0006C994C0|nr:jerky protein-like [Trichogramma pretiosum]
MSKRKRLTLAEKINIINECEKTNESYRAAGEKFGVSKSLIGEILNEKEELRSLFAQNGNVLSKKRFAKTYNLSIDSLTYEWLCRARAQNIPISGPLIQEKALEISAEIVQRTKDYRLVDFKASYGWLHKFRIRHKITYKTVSGEAGSVDQNEIASWKII